MIPRAVLCPERSSVGHGTPASEASPLGAVTRRRGRRDRRREPAHVRAEAETPHGRHDRARRGSVLATQLKAAVNGEEPLVTVARSQRSYFLPAVPAPGPGLSGGEPGSGLSGDGFGGS